MAPIAADRTGMYRVEGGPVRTRQRLRPVAVVLVSLAAWLLALSAGTAGAQERDPFDPLVGESGGAATAVPTGGATTQPAPVEQPAPAPAPAEQLPATGGDATRFVVVALALICAGVGVTIVSQSFGTRAALAVFRSAARDPS
jgi:hypothetical protein